MRVLFIHDNHPAQFGALGSALAQQGWDITFLTRKADHAPLKGVRTLAYRVKDKPAEGLHPFLAPSERAVLNGASAMAGARRLREQGYVPDLVVAHSGWGGGLFVKDIWPEASLIAYCEWYYRGDAEDCRFTRGREATPAESAAAHARNAPMLLDLIACDLAIVPTRFQAAQFPAEFRPKIRVLHDGVDTALHRPGKARGMELDGKRFLPGEEIVTYATRGMEPYRGFPTFMRALAALQKERPGMKAIVLGSDRVAYGARLPEGESWKTRMLGELDLDLDRIAMPGFLKRDAYANVLRLSSAHAYLTVPFVLSWSLLEAMASGCAVAASNTEPVREVITHEKEGLLVPWGDTGALKEALGRLLDDPATARDLAGAARGRVLSSYRFDDHVAAKKLLFEEAAAMRKEQKPAP
jgi:glycosyltransferase involved in cell wall biosynthesis